MPGWESRGSFCYEFISQKKTWADSESYCQSKGGHLISFADASERVRWFCQNWFAYCWVCL